MLQNAACIFFIVLFIYATTWEGMIFGGITERLWSFPKWLKKPLFECPICMTPWYGAVILTLMISGGMTQPLPATEFVLTLFVAAGMTVAIILLSTPSNEPSDNNCTGGNC